ncbi:MAG TPA: DUF4332 domain-containing protein [Verrucomicrobiales bacterium]|nr:DUF4332 domain-containing protein [Verrucomicrobiales bacterium]
MTPLTTITGLSAESAELLAAASIHSTSQLAIENAAHLHSRLELIAWQRGRGARVPAKEHLEQWIAVARMLTPEEEAEAMSVDEIPEAVTEPVAQRTQAWVPPSQRAAQVISGGSTASPHETLRAPETADNTWRKVDPSKFATIEDYNEGRIAVKPLSRDRMDTSAREADSDVEAAPSRRPQRIRSKGEPLSRWVRRGVVHSRPLHTWIGALVSVVWRIAFVIGIAAFIYLITQVQDPTAYKTEVIEGALVLAVLGCMQLHFVGRARCRICSCNLFYSKNCLKNRKAHHIPGLGYVASLSLHLLIFGWFRCMYCGTAIRLRPTKREEDGD